MDKYAVAKILEEMALLLELQGANAFKVRAYQTAAQAISQQKDDLRQMAATGTLTQIEGIGESLASKITELVLTGHLPAYEEIKKATPPGLLALLQLHGIGAKKIKALHELCGIQSIADLKKACQEGLVAKLPGFGEKTEHNILEAIAHQETYQKRRLWYAAMELAQPIVEALRQLPQVQTAEIAGSLRRRLETIGDIDFVVASSQPQPIMEWFITQPWVEQVLGQGDTKASVLLREGMQADLRIVPAAQYGFALCHTTGSKEHNIKLRQIALSHGWTLSEWGLTALNPGQPVPLAGGRRRITEKDLYAALGLAFIPPELREDRGEIEAAKLGALPALVQDKDLRGAFHNHTVASDGRNTLEEMVAAAEMLGWEYIGISDHSKSSLQANGLSAERLMQQLEVIRELNASKRYQTHIFAGTECDILPDGTLDFPDEVLSQLDYVVASVHSAFQQEEELITQRILRAVENPYVTMLGHLTGRLLLRREPYAVNTAQVIDACIANGTVIELNANPWRLDMDWRLWQAAAEKGLLCSINPDAHATEHLQFVKIGVGVARKGWLTKRHIINTKPLKAIQKILRQKRSSSFVL